MNNKRLYFFILFILANTLQAVAQKALPQITVKDINGKIVISWMNDYKENTSNISIQRSWDSLKNYVTIGTVLNAMNKENGFADANAPYNRMYYRVFISFEGGKYIYSDIATPTRGTTSTESNEIKYSWQVIPEPLVIKKDTTFAPKPITVIKPKPEIVNPVVITKPKIEIAKQVDSIKTKKIEPEKAKEEITYPSLRIYTTKENTVTINLPDAAIKKYSVKFFNESGKEIFSLDKLQEDYLILEKVNFVHSGWFLFELFDGNTLIEKNKIFIPKDLKNNN